MKRFVFSIGTLATLALAMPALAHVIVTPNQVGVGSAQSFITGVPTEKDGNTVEVRLVIPGGLSDVTPNVKPGWQIDVKKDGDNVTEITWSGGSIPTGQRDDFEFSAEVPAKATTLIWKAYQTYDDGTVVAWDQTPGSKSDGATPYSETAVVNDLAASPAVDRLPLYLSIAAVVIAAIAVLKPVKK